MPILLAILALRIRCLEEMFAFRGLTHIRSAIRFLLCEKATKDVATADIPWILRAGCAQNDTALKRDDKSVTRPERNLAATCRVYGKATKI